MKYLLILYGWCFLCAFPSLICRRVALDIPLFDEFIRIRRRRKNRWKAISHVHTGKKRHTYEYIHIPPKKKTYKFIWSSLQTVFFYLFCFCCVCVPATSVFIVFRFRGIFHLLLFIRSSVFFICWLPFLLSFFVCVCDFGILPLFEYATTDQKWININYATQLNHRTHSNNDSPELKAYHRPWNSFMDKTFAHNKWKKTQAPYQMDPFSVGQSELATITIK